MLKLENLVVLVLFIIRLVMMPKKPLKLWMVWNFQIMVKRFKLGLLNPIGRIVLVVVVGVEVEVEEAEVHLLGHEDHPLHGPEVRLDTVGVVDHHLGNEDRHLLGPEVHHHLGNEITVMDPGVVEGAADGEDLMVEVEVDAGVDVDVVGDEIVMVVETVLLVDLMCISNCVLLDWTVSNSHPLPIKFAASPNRLLELTNRILCQ